MSHGSALCRVGGGVVCTFHLRVTTPELRLQPRVCPSDGLGAAPGVDPWHLLEKWSIKCAPKQRIQKGTCCRDPHDGSTAKPIDLRMTLPSGVPVTSGFPCRGLAAAGPACIPCPARPSSCSIACLPSSRHLLSLRLFVPASSIQFCFPKHWEMVPNTMAPPVSWQNTRA